MFKRPTSQELERAIVDVAAGLVARHGVAQTSLQAIASEVGYSKAGVLHHFPTKDAIVVAAVAQCRHLALGVLELAEELPAGPGRDRVVVRALVGLADEQPGCAALLLASSTTDLDVELGRSLQPVTEDLFRAFDVPPGSPDVARIMAVVGALGALTVCMMAIKKFEPLARSLQHHQLLTLIEQTALSALAHASSAGVE